MPGTDIQLQDIQKQVETIRKVLEDVIKIINMVDADRSAVISLINVTDLSLTQTYNHHSSGGFAGVPKKFVDPRSGTAWGSQSSGFMRGAVGTVHYAGDGVSYFCDWNVPYFGENHSSTSLKDATGRYREWHVSGAGNEKAQFEYTLYQIREQGAWRSCDDCMALYFDGWPDNKGHCPGRLAFAQTKIGGKLVQPPHRSTGWEYFLSHDYAPARNQAAGWRYCQKCNMLFFDGHAEKGRCVEGGGHEAAGFNFLVPFVAEFPLAGKQQGGWRICEDCFGLFFSPWPDKGVCTRRGKKHRFDENSYDYALNYR